MLKNYFKTALRNLARNKTHSFLNIFGLAIGIACAGLIFLWVEDEITFDNINKKKASLYKVNVNMKYENNVFTMGSTPRILAASLKNEIPGIANTARVSDEPQRALFSWQDKALYAPGLYADASIFNMFTMNFIAGNAQNAFPSLYSLVITETAAKKFFGNETSIIGKRLRMNNKQDFVISAIIKDLPENSTLQFDWLAPYQVSMNYEDSQAWDSYGPFTYVELDGTTTATEVNRKIKTFITQKQADQKSELFLFSMKDWRLHDDFANGRPTAGGRIQQVYLLSAIAWILLLIACINFMNLSTANSLKRAKEVGVRKVMGVGRKGLVFQFMGEALLMSFFATIAGVVIISLSLPAFNTLMQKTLLLQVGNPVHLSALIIIALTCGLVAGSYPSLYLSSFNPVTVLKGLSMKVGNAAIIRKSLVVVQFTVSVVLIICTVVVYLQIQHVRNRNLWFNKDNLVEINLHRDFSGSFSMLKQDLLHTGLVENAAMTTHVTINGGDTDDRFKWRGKAEGSQVDIAFRNVSAEYISTVGIKIVAGRDFTNDTAYEKNNVIISESLAKLMGNESAVGKVIQSPRNNKDGVYTDCTVVGVVHDYVFGNLYGQSRPVIFFCRPPDWDKLVYVRLKPNASAENAIEKLQAVLKKDNPAYPMEYKFVDEQFNKKISNEIQLSKVSGIFSVLTIIISCLGLFGLAAYTAERRIKEIGIRKVLGASVSGIAGLLSKDFLQLVLIACLVAFPAAWWIMHNWLQGYNYRIAISWWIFFLSGSIAVLIALFTISFQAIKAAMANPVKSLRSE
ncbi:MAG: ABC transporter permease [Chitinophagaceae bacterium]